MKQRIFNKGRGWYISASNYKNKEDKAYMNVHFAVCSEPIYRPAGDNPFTFIDINIVEQKYEAYQGKIGLTVFKYEIIKPTQEGMTEMDRQEEKYAVNQEEPADFNVDIAPEDLPFY